MEKIRAYAVMAPSITAANNSFKKNYKRIKIRQIKKTVVTTVAGDGTAGFLNGPSLTAKFKSPLDIAVLSDGTIYVADAFNSCIRKIEGGQVTTFAGNGNANIKNGNSTAARFKIPSRLTLDVEGNLYTLDAADPRVRKITPAADVSTYVGKNTFGFKDGETGIAQFGQSFGIVTDLQGNIYIADSQNDRIRKISVTGEVTTIAGTGIQGLSDGKGDTAQFYFATGIAIEKQGNLFVSDVTRIRKITPEGVVSTFAGSNVKGHVDGKRRIAQFSQIEDIIIDEQENIYVTDENCIRKISINGNVSTIAGSTAGYQDGDAASAKFDGPQGLALDKQGNIYVADFNNNRIRKISFE
jgi:sugar lactone lactonase YvrE